MNNCCILSILFLPICRIKRIPEVVELVLNLYFQVTLVLIPYDVTNYNMRF